MWGCHASARRIGLLFLASLMFSGCNGPVGFIPGGALSGPVVPANIKDLPPQVTGLVLETRPDDPYSVNLGFVRIADRIFIDPDPARAWASYLLADKNARIRFGDSKFVHPVTARVITDKEIVAMFDESRVVVELIPRLP